MDPTEQVLNAKRLEEDKDEQQSHSKRTSVVYRGQQGGLVAGTMKLKE